MGQTLTNGIYLPNEGERNCYSGLAANWNAVDTLKGNYSLHAINVDIHVTAAEKETWNGKADASALTAHTGDTTIHVTSADKQAWDGHVADTTIHVTSADKQAWNGKADASALTAHTGDTTIHVTAADKQAWNGKADASALTAHTGDTTIHVTSADKQAWNGKADASALTAHTGDTTIHVTSADKQAWNGHVADSVKHVTAEDKNKWDAVTSKADDSAVVHKTGNETASGEKTFANMSSFQGSYLGSESSTNARTVQILESNRDTHGQSGLCFTKFRQNKPQGGLTSNDVVYLALDILENSVRTNNAIRFNFKDFVNDVPTSVAFYPTGNNNSLGGSTSAVNKWTKINGVEPGALGMPDLSNGIDISSYITHLDKVVNNYTPPSNGWLSIRLKKTSLTHASLMMYQTGGLLSSCETTEFSISGTNLPVIANQKVEIYIIADSLVSAKFYPCRGNI